MSFKRLLGAGLACAMLFGGAARAEDPIQIGLIGSPQAGSWPYYVGIQKGFFAAVDLKPEIVYVRTASGLVQQLAAGSLDICNIGVVEPIHAVARGAPVAILRITGDVAPYEMIAAKTIKTIEELKGHTVVIGGLIDINRVYLERVLKAARLKDSDITITIVGNTAGRFAALKSGAADATMLLPPTNFVAESEGYTNLGRMTKFAGDLPFGSTNVSLAFAKDHADALKRFLAAFDKSIRWFNDPANREAAIDVLDHEMSSPNKPIVAQSYDFMQELKYFSNDNVIPKKRLEKLMDEMVAIGDTNGRVPLEKLVLPGVATIGD